MTDPLETLYRHLAAGRKPGVRDLPPDERRAYYRDASRRRRERQRQAMEAGRRSRPTGRSVTRSRMPHSRSWRPTRPGPTRSGESSPASSLAVPESPAR